MVKIYKNHIILFLIVLVAFNFYLWQALIFNAEDFDFPVAYFLDVGQGDAALILLPTDNQRDAIKILIDGGRGNQATKELDAILGGFRDKYLDLVVLTHPDQDHYGGLISVLRHYRVGAFLYNGQKSASKSFINLEKLLLESDTPVIALAASDAIQYRQNNFAVLSSFRGSDKTNENGLVIMANLNEIKILFAADIGRSIEGMLADIYDLKADILKVGHHGSKNSSSVNFISEIDPLISVISVGVNSYGHPHPTTLKTLADAGSGVYRTDKDGTIKIVLNDE